MDSAEFVSAVLESPETALPALAPPLNALATFWKAVKFFGPSSTALMALKSRFRVKYEVNRE